MPGHARLAPARRQARNKTVHEYKHIEDTVYVIWSTNGLVMIWSLYGSDFSRLHRRPSPINSMERWGYKHPPAVTGAIRQLHAKEVHSGAAADEASSAGDSDEAGWEDILEVTEQQESSPAADGTDVAHPPGASNGPGDSEAAARAAWEARRVPSAPQNEVCVF